MIGVWHYLDTRRTEEVRLRAPYRSDLLDDKIGYRDSAKVLPQPQRSKALFTQTV